MSENELAEAQATERVIRHVAVWAQGIARETSDDEERIGRFVTEVLSHETVRLWVAMEVARLTARVH